MYHLSFSLCIYAVDTIDSRYNYKSYYLRNCGNINTLFVIYPYNRISRNDGFIQNDNKQKKQ